MASTDPTASSSGLASENHILPVVITVAIIHKYGLAPLYRFVFNAICKLPTHVVCVGYDVD